MYIVVGLGNPEKKYEHTRHNVGFDVLNVLSQQENIPINKSRCKALTGEGNIAGQKTVLAAPQTYMNLSGESLVELVNYYKLDPESELIVIYDDISFSPGNLRIRESGSAGGHNGVKSIIKCLNTQRFMRIKVGVGEKPKDWDLADFVLGRFTKEEREHLEGAMERAAEAVCYMVNGEVAKAMNEYNKKVTD